MVHKRPDRLPHVQKQIDERTKRFKARFKAFTILAIALYLIATIYVPVVREWTLGFIVAFALGIGTIGWIWLWRR